jgi:hypothetical protein
LKKSAQKTFILWGGAGETAHAPEDSKVFLVLFFQKKHGLLKERLL